MQMMKDRPVRRSRRSSPAMRSQDVLTALRRIIRATDRLTRRGRNLLAKTPPLLHEKFTEAFSGLSAARQDRIITTLDEIAAMMGAADLDAAPLLDSGSPVKRAE